MFRCLFVFVVFICSQSLHAADYDVNVCSVQSHPERKTVYMSPCGGWESKNNCPNNKFVSWSIVPEGNGELMYSTALAAMLSDKRVSLRLDGSSCAAGYDAISMVRIIN